MRDLWKYDPDAETFTRLEDSLLTYVFHNAHVVGDTMYVLGSPNVLSVYDMLYDSWDAFHGYGSPMDGRSSSVLTKNADGKSVIVLFGGYDGYGESDEVYEFDTAARTITEREERMPIPVYDGAAALLPALPGTASLPRDEPTATNQVRVLLFGGSSDGTRTNATLYFSSTGTPPPERTTYRRRHPVRRPAGDVSKELRRDEGAPAGSVVDENR